MSVSKQSQVIQLDDEKSQTQQQEPPAQLSPTKAKLPLNPDEFPKISQMLQKRAERNTPIQIPQSPPSKGAIPLPMQQEKIYEANVISQVQHIKVVEDLQGLKTPDVLDEFRKRCSKVVEDKRNAHKTKEDQAQIKGIENKNSLEEGQIAASQEAQAAQPTANMLQEATKQVAVQGQNEKTPEIICESNEQKENSGKPAEEKNVSEVQNQMQKADRQIKDDNAMIAELRNESQPQSMDVELPRQEIPAQDAVEPVPINLSNTLSAPTTRIAENLQSNPVPDHLPTNMQEARECQQRLVSQDKPLVTQEPNQQGFVEPQASQMHQQPNKENNQPEIAAENQNIQPSISLPDKQPENQEAMQAAPEDIQQKEPAEQSLSLDDLQLIKKRILRVLPNEADKLEANGLEGVKEIYLELKKEMNIDFLLDQIDIDKPEGLPKQVAEIAAQNNRCAIPNQQIVKPSPEVMDLDASIEEDKNKNAQEPQEKNIEPAPSQTVLKQRRYSFGKEHEINGDDKVEPQKNAAEHGQPQKTEIHERQGEQSSSKKIVQQSMQKQRNGQQQQSKLPEINSIRTILMQRVPDIAKEINQLNDQDIKMLLSSLNNSAQKKSAEKDHQYEEILNECIRLKPEMAEELKKMDEKKVREIYEDCKRKPLKPTNTNTHHEAIQLDSQDGEKNQKVGSKKIEAVKSPSKRVTIVEPEKPQNKRSHEDMMETNQKRPEVANEKKKKVYTTEEIRQKLLAKLPQLKDHIAKLNDSEIHSIWEESVEKKQASNNKEKQSAYQGKKDSAQTNGRPGILKAGEKVRVYDNSDEKRQKKTRTVVMVQTQFDNPEHEGRQVRSRAEDGSTVKKCNCDCCRKLDVNQLLRRLADLIEEKK